MGFEKDRITFKQIKNSFTEDELSYFKILKHTAINGREDCLIKVIDKLRLKGSSLIEIGTYRGLSSIVFSHYFEKVFTYDVKIHPAKKIVYRKLNVNNNITDLTFYNRKGIREAIKELKQKNYIDYDSLAFIDGKHNFWETGKDFLMCAEFGVKRFLFHDLKTKNKEMIKLAKVLGIERVDDTWGYLVI